MPADIAGPAEDKVLVAALTRVIERHVAYSLVASDGVSERFFYFAIGGVRVIGSGPRRSSTIADMLLESGKVSAEGLNRVLGASRDDGQAFAESVLSLGLATREDLDAAMRAKVEDEILDLFLWDGAEIRLEEGQPPAAFYQGRVEAARASCDVTSLIQTVLARVEEWRGMLGRLPALREVFESSNTALTEYQDGPKGALVGHLDGTRTANDAVARSGLRRATAYGALLEMLRDTRIRRVPASAAQKVTREELTREVAALGEALTTAIDPTVVRARLARALEQVGEATQAAAQWRNLGDHFRRENQLDRALECYRAGVRTVPTDFATRELILEIHRHTRDFGQLVADGRPLADLFLKHNLLNRAKNLLIQLVGLEAEDTALRRQLIMVLIGLGERDLALKYLRELAKILDRRKAPATELRDVYMRILALDKKDRHAQDRLDTITGAKFQRRMLRATIGATAAALLVLAGWYVYERAARHQVNEAVESAKKDVQHNDFAAAKSTLQGAIDSYAYARASGTAYNVLQQIERYELRERERSLQIDTKTAAQRDEAAARALVQRAIDLTDAGKTDEAYRTYREVFDVFGDVSLLDTVSLPLNLTVLPLDARVRLAGQEVGQGAQVVRYTPRSKCTLEVEREGYVTFKKVLDGPQEASLVVSLQKPTRWTFSGDAAIDAPPLVSGGMVYVAGRDRCLTAMSAADGAVQWRTPLGFYSDVAVPPVMTSAGVFAATANGEAVCVDPMSGTVLWRKPVGACVDRAPVAVGAGAVLVSGNDGSLRSFSAASGETLWTLPANALAASPAVIDADQMAYVDQKGALVYASTATGAPLPGYTQPAVLKGSPVADAERLWVRAEDGSLCVISTASRRALRRCPVPGALDLAPAVTDSAVYAVSAEGNFYAFRPTGESLFHGRIDEAAGAPPAVSKGRLYLAGQKSRLYVLDAATGALLWRFEANSRITSAPLIVDGTVYVVTAGGKLFAVQE